MREAKYQIDFSDYERRALIGVLAEKRNDCLKEDFPTEDVNVLLEKALEAQPKKQKKKDRDER